MTRNTLSDGEPFSVAALNSLKHAFQGEGQLSGGAITPGTGDFDVDITEMDYIVNDSGFTATAATKTLSSPGAEDRVDLITATTTPDFNVVEGDVASTTDQPNAKDIPTNEVLVGLVYVDSEATEITSGDIFDGYKTPVQTLENWTTDGADGTIPISDGNGSISMSFQTERGSFTASRGVSQQSVSFNNTYRPGTALGIVSMDDSPGTTNDTVVAVQTGDFTTDGSGNIDGINFLVRSGDISGDVSLLYQVIGDQI